MRVQRLTTLIIKFLIALLIVLLIGFLPLRDMLYPRPEYESEGVITATPTLHLPDPTTTPITRQNTPDPAQIEPVVEQIEPLWIPNHSDGVVLRIDPRLAEITGRIEVDGTLDAVAAGESGVWLAVTTERNLSQIVRIDPEDLSSVAVIPIYSGKIRCLQAGAGAVWVGVDQSPLENSAAGNLLRIDPISNEINAILPRPGVPAEIVIYAQAVWLLEEQKESSVVGRLDTTSLQITTFSAPDTDQAFNHLSIGAAGIWATASEDGANFLFQLDPSNGKVLVSLELGEIEGRPVALAAISRNVVVWLSNGALLQVDPTKQQIVSRTATKPGVGNLHPRPGALWIENESEAELYRFQVPPDGVIEVLSTGSKPAPTPVPTPTLLPGTKPACDARYPTRLEKGGRAVVNLDPPVPNRVRSEPHARAEVIGQIEPGEMINLVDGPICNNGWVWWYIQSRKSGLTGWTSEGDRNEYWLSPLE
jgi:streptogramin lyase